MLTLAFDTATSVATTALVRDGEPLGERTSRALTVLEDAQDVLAANGVEPRQLTGIVVGTGPGSFTGVRMGVAAARTLALALELPLAGVSTLSALAAVADAALPVVDAGRREVFTLVDGEPVVVAPADLRLERGTLCVGDGAVRYRSVLEQLGGVVPERDSDLHLPRARFHALLARDFGEPDAVEPLYLRVPDAEQKR
jgi:tRNA threonylcarbamoyladenosine biosynthesis protein TsaB